MPERAGSHDGLTFIRAAACLMVIAVHSVECFYISTTGQLMKEHGEAVTVLGSALRACVPLFVMVTGALLLPIRSPSGTFLARRLGRVLLPLASWSALYGVALFLRGAYDGATCLKMLALIPVQFSPYVGHLWYVYMLLGLYLLIPVISPWIERASERELTGFLALWGITLTLPYARRWQPQLLGEAHWNSISTLYYFSGYVGYLVLGHLLARRRPARSAKWRTAVAGALVLLGYATTLMGFRWTLPGAQSVPGLELFWQFDTINVAVMAAGLFDLGLSVRGGDRWWFRALDSFSSASYAVYLAHIFVLSELFLRWGRGRSPWVVVPLLASVTALITYLGVAVLAFLPKAGVWLGAKKARRLLQSERPALESRRQGGRHAPFVSTLEGASPREADRRGR